MKLSPILRAILALSACASLRLSAAVSNGCINTFDPEALFSEASRFGFRSPERFHATILDPHHGDKIRDALHFSAWIDSSGGDAFFTAFADSLRKFREGKIFVQDGEMTLRSFLDDTGLLIRFPFSQQELDLLEPLGAMAVPSNKTYEFPESTRAQFRDALARVPIDLKRNVQQHAVGRTKFLSKKTEVGQKLTMGVSQFAQQVLYEHLVVLTPRYGHQVHSKDEWKQIIRTEALSHPNEDGRTLLSDVYYPAMLHAFVFNLLGVEDLSRIDEEKLRSDVAAHLESKITSWKSHVNFAPSRTDVMPRFDKVKDEPEVRTPTREERMAAHAVEKAAQQGAESTEPEARSSAPEDEIAPEIAKPAVATTNTFTYEELDYVPAEWKKSEDRLAHIQGLVTVDHFASEAKYERFIKWFANPLPGDIAQKFYEIIYNVKRKVPFAQFGSKLIKMEQRPVILRMKANRSHKARILIFLTKDNNILRISEWGEDDKDRNRQNNLMERAFAEQKTFFNPEFQER